MPQGSVAAALGKASSSGPGRVLARTRCDSGGDRSQACRKRRERAPEPAVVCLTRLPQRTIRESTGRARADYRNGRRKRVPADWRLGLLLIVRSDTVGRVGWDGRFATEAVTHTQRRPANPAWLTTRSCEQSTGADHDHPVNQIATARSPTSASHGAPAPGPAPPIRIVPPRGLPAWQRKCRHAGRVRWVMPSPG
jgi:hypothetical protein